MPYRWLTSRWIATGTPGFFGVIMWGALCLSGIAQEAAPVAEDPVAADPERAAVQQLLDAAWSGDKQAAGYVQQLYESRRAQVQNRPRWDYAYGIAALNLKRYPLAAQAFSSAVADSKSFDFASWKALLWTELTLKKYDEALKHLRELGTIVVAENFPGSAEDRDRVAVWVGQTLLALEKIITLPKVQEQLAQLDTDLRKSWPPDVLDAYQSGRDYSQATYADLMDELNVAQDIATTKEVSERNKKLDELQDQVVAAGEVREGLKKTAAEVQQKTEERLLQIDKQLARLERDYGILESRGMSLLRSISIIQAEIFVLENPRAANRPILADFPNRPSAKSPPLEQLKLLLAAHEWELQLTTYRASLISNQAMQGMQMRQQTILTAQQAVGQLELQDANLEKWQQRQSQTGERLKTAKLKVATPSIRQKREQAKSLNTYLDFHLDLERLRLTEP